MKNNKNYKEEKKRKETEIEKENGKENKRHRQKEHNYSRCIRWKKSWKKG